MPEQPSSPQNNSLFSLNLDTNAEHIRQSVEDHINRKTSHSRANSQDRDDQRHRQQQSSVETLIRPFEHTVQKTFEGVLREKRTSSPVGKKIVSVGSGKLSLETQTNVIGTPSTTKTVLKQDITGGNTHRRERDTYTVASLPIEDQYDTSEL
ncbi:unnamed protein product [Periconia digitata]|uniref:Uncharacterized protein n=1 Tax=Periconia digitata TaxID=1303443 RepID=A0A9W4XQK1_9PLEO|nr:unnamed protein product [Periconia digitata]